VDEILNRSTGLDAYRRDDPLTGQILAHYRFNLNRMVGMARSVGARVVLVTVPVNKKDFGPFKSQSGDQADPDARERVRTLITRGEAAIARNDLQAARESLELAVETDPRHAESHYRLGRVLLALGHTALAEASLRRAIVEDVCPLRALPAINEILHEVAEEHEVALLDFEDLLEGRMQAEHGHRSTGDEYFLDHVHPTVEANGLLARALVDRMAAEGLARVEAGWHDRVGGAVISEVLARADDEARAVAFKNLSKVLIWAGKTREAERYVRRAEELLADDWEVHYNAGVVDMENGEPDRALDRFAEAVRLNPGAADAHAYLGTALAELGRVDEAIAAGERAVSSAPDRATAHNNLAISYTEAGRISEAREAAAQAVRLRPDFAEAHNSLGNALFAAGRLDDALASYDRAVELLPAYVEALVNRGLLLGAQERLDEAATAFTRALRHDAQAVGAHVGLGRARLGQGDVAAAIVSFRRAVSVDGTRDVPHEWLTRSLLQAGRGGDARQALAVGLAAAPESPGLLNLSAQLAATEQRFDEAIGLLRRALAALPLAHESTVAADELHSTLANLLILTNRIEPGRSHLRQALALNPDNVRALNDLGLVYEHDGRLPRALEQYQRAVQLDAGFEPAARNLERVRRQLAAR
jgi:tetratricopeptide (TPR) repeat protein